MRTSLLKYFFLPVVALLFTSCNDWLDIKPSDRLILTTADDYGMLFDNTAYINIAIEDISYLDDELWLNPLVVANAQSTMNLVVANYTYKTDYDRSENATNNAGGASTLYQSMYERISKIANTIVYDYENGKMEGADADKKAVAAQARMLRAYSYFMLVNVYAKPYNSATAASDGAVPLKLDISLETTPPKATVAQIYEQIERDVTDALPYLPETAKTPFRFNLAGGYAFKAKVHLFKREFDKCITAAEQSYILNHTAANLATLVNPATNKPTTPILAEDSENLYFATTATPVNYIGTDLKNLFETSLTAYGQAATVTDARYALYKQPTASTRDYLYTRQYVPGNKEYAPNYCGIRTTEVMLMLAECYARQANNTKVKEYLQPYFESRYKNYVHANLTVPANVVDAVKFVLAERRKELRMGYNRFFDLRRLNLEPEYQVVPSRTLPMDLAATTNLPQATYTLPINSALYVLPFPTKVIANDPSLTSNTMN